MSASLILASLRYADQVARAGSIQRAAKELNIAASAVDRQILILEETLGVALFERVPRGMKLTAAGGVLITMIRRWKSDERQVTAEIQQLRGVNQGQVRLVAMDSHANGFLPDFIARLAAEHARIQLEVVIATPDEAAAALAAGHVDVAAVFNLPSRRELDVLWSTDLPLGCVVAPTHDLAKGAATSLQEAAAYPIALQSRAILIRRFLESRYGWLLAESRRVVETNSLQLVKSLARSGEYVAFTSELDAAPELAEGSLVFVPVRDSGAEAQSISVAIDARKPLTQVVRTVAEGLQTAIHDTLAQVRGR